MAIIGISGKIGSGKDLTGTIIKYLTCDYGSKNFRTFEEYLKAEGRYSLESIDGKRYESSWKVVKFATKLKQMVCLLTGCTMEQLEDQAFKDTKLGPEWDWYKVIGTSNGKPTYIRGTVTDQIRKELGDRVYSTTYRELLQLLGTEALRNVIHENVHVNALFTDYKILDGHEVHSKYEDLGGYSIGFLPKGEMGRIILEKESKVKNELKEFIRSNSSNWIITDTRFPNEAKAIKDRNGLLIRVERPCEECGVIEGHKMIPHKKEPSNHPSEIGLDQYQGFDYKLWNDGTIKDLVEKVRKILIQEKIINETN